VGSCCEVQKLESNAVLMDMQCHFVSGSKNNDPLFQIMFLPFLTMSRFLTKKKSQR